MATLPLRSILPHALSTPTNNPTPTGKTSIVSEYLRGLDKDTDRLLCVTHVVYARMMGGLPSSSAN